ncbi:MAG TPA: hypothetical protein VMJ10_15480 [Kofleriaceae bacterium]|nr:hypothetical protein [Kofleriaceae bacterium]
MRAFSLAVCLVAACGSSSSSSDSLNCSFLLGDNCWKTTASAAASCLPMSSEQGTFSADHSTCTYASGDLVTFTPALTLPLPQTPVWNFAVTTGGASCLAYKEDSTGFTLTVQGQTVTETSLGGITLTCPGGQTYSNSNPLALLGCGGDAGATFGDLPGTEFSSSGNEVLFGLSATSTTSPDELVVFDCL